MAFNWESYIKFASELKNENDEAKLRTAVSRGYYGAYHKTRIKVGKTGTEFANHQEIIECLRNSQDIDNCELLANQLDNLKQSRVNADYKSFKTIDKLYVNSFWARLDRYLKGLNTED